MSNTIEFGPDFAATMQELSAQAAGTAPHQDPRNTTGNTGPGFAELLSALHLLGQRMETLEISVSEKFDALQNATSGPADFAQQFQKLDEQLTAIRKSETVNQQLFDSLHQELKSYRDNFVRDSLQKPFIRDLLVLHDDLSAIAAQLEKAGAAEKRAATSRLRDNLGNALHFLLEILHRLEVTEIESKDTVDLQLHSVVSYEPADCHAEDGRIVRRVKRGFMWRGRVLRAEEVIARRFR